MTPDWPGHLSRFHDERSGITESVLGRAEAGSVGNPYSWLVEPLRTETGPILDLACGSAPTGPLLAGSGWFGVDDSPGELALAAAAGRGPLVRARADQLPVADGSVDAVCAAMSLQVLMPLEAVLAEVRRVLRSGGRVVALVPAGLGPRRGVLVWWRVLRALGVRSPPWPNPQGLHGLAGTLRGSGFVVNSDERRFFQREIADPTEAALLIDSLYLPGVAPVRVRSATHVLGRWARPGRTLPLPLRRVVAHLPDGVDRPRDARGEWFRLGRSPGRIR